MPGSVTQAPKSAQQELSVEPVLTSVLRREFVELPYRMYARHPYWVPQLRRDEYRRLDPAHNPFLDHADLMLWLVRRGPYVAGRIAAIHDRLHNETHGENVTWFGLFEASDAKATRVLLETAEQWARQHGSRIVRGPANLSLNESAGLLVDAFDSAPAILMPYNPPEYVRYVEAAGYRKAKDLLAWEIDLAEPPTDRIVKLAERVGRRHGITIRTVDMNEFDRDLSIFQSIYQSAWIDNWGFVPPTDAEIRQLAVDLKPIIDPELVLFAEMQGRPVACAIAIPNANQVLKKMNGRLFPFGFIHFLRRRQSINEARLLLLGVVPEVRRIGIYPLIVHEIQERGRRRGYIKGELSWTLEDNDAINAGIVAAGGKRAKTYRVYEKTLG
jgi:GNAT superfamily N-acetyltransferase